MGSYYWVKTSRRDEVNARKFRVSVFNPYCITHRVLDNDKLTPTSRVFFIETKEKFSDFSLNITGSIIEVMQALKTIVEVIEKKCFF